MHDEWEFAALSRQTELENFLIEIENAKMESQIKPLKRLIYMFRRTVDRPDAPKI